MAFNGQDFTRPEYGFFHVNKGTPTLFIVQTDLSSYDYHRLYIFIP